MEENGNLLTAFNALGEKIERVESDLRFEKFARENAEAAREKALEQCAILEAENELLARKLDEVKEHLEKYAR